MPGTDINYLAVLIAAILSMAIGALWYSPAMFSKPWMKLVGKKEKDLQGGSSVAYAIAMLAFLLIAFVMAHFVRYVGANNVVRGLETGLWLWMGFVATTMAINYAFGQRPQKLWAIDAGYFLVTFLVSGALLAAWS